MEINAGAWYLRPLRHDDRIDDVPALVEAFSDPAVSQVVPDTAGDPGAAAAYVARRCAQWADGTSCSWAVCEPTTGAMVAEIAVHGIDHRDRTGELGCYTLPAQRRRGVLRACLPVVVRYAFGALDLHRISYRHAAANVGSQRLVQGCGFVYEGRLRDAVIVDGRRDDMLCWSRLATDR